MYSWRVATLLRLALSRSSNWSWTATLALQCKGTREVLVAAGDLCKSNVARERRIGAAILAELGAMDRTFPAAVGRILRELLRRERNAKVLVQVVAGFVHNARAVDHLTLRRIVHLARHRNWEVRHSVVVALGARHDRASLRTLVVLSGDPVGFVREPATFYLMDFTRVDDPLIRRALWRRVDDTYDDTKYHAIKGLAHRKAPGIREVIARELLRESPSPLIFDAAAYLGDGSLLPHLQRHLRRASQGENVDADWKKRLRASIARLR